MSDVEESLGITSGESEEEKVEDVIEKPKAAKKPRSEKQLEALSRGRAVREENK
jgi:hypothetical protein